MDPRAERSRRRALDAAEALFVAEGVDAVTHLRVAAASGVGRRTLYRHWPERRALLHDTFARTRAPAAAGGDDLRAGLVAHLRALAAAVHEGPLARIVATLCERSAHDADLAALRADLVAAGCAPLRERLQAAVRRGELPRRLDVEEAVAELEGPVFYRAILHGRRTTATEVAALVDRFLDRVDTRAVRPTRR